MIERIGISWRILASGRFGLRFRERYRLHQSRRRGGLDLVRYWYIVVGALLISVSALFGWLIPPSPRPPITISLSAG